jgi:hypothetical protein
VLEVHDVRPDAQRAPRGTRPRPRLVVTLAQVACCSTVRHAPHRRPSNSSLVRALKSGGRPRRRSSAAGARVRIAHLVSAALHLAREPERVHLGARPRVRREAVHDVQHAQRSCAFEHARRRKRRVDVPPSCRPKNAALAQLLGQRELARRAAPATPRRQRLAVARELRSLSTSRVVARRDADAVEPLGVELAVDLRALAHLLGP